MLRIAAIASGLSSSGYIAKWGSSKPHLYMISVSIPPSVRKSWPSCRGGNVSAVAMLPSRPAIRALFRRPEHEHARGVLLVGCRAGHPDEGGRRLDQPPPVLGLQGVDLVLESAPLVRRGGEREDQQAAGPGHPQQLVEAAGWRVAGREHARGDHRREGPVAERE